MSATVIPFEFEIDDSGEASACQVCELFSGEVGIQADRKRARMCRSCIARLAATCRAALRVLKTTRVKA
jgi:hypothetical protein